MYCTFVPMQYFSSGTTGRGLGPPTPVKTSQKKMAATPCRKFRESAGSPSGKFLEPLLIVTQIRSNHIFIY